MGCFARRMRGLALAFASMAFAVALCPATASAMVAADSGQNLANPSALATQGTASPHGYIWPLKVAGTLIPTYSGHTGRDIGVPVGTEVVAMMDGTVKWVQKWDGVTKTGNQSFGNAVAIFHPKTGATTIYAHLRDYSVAVGQKVSQYQVIGHTGLTGNTTGPHLHIEMHTGTTYAGNYYMGSIVNPYDYVSQSNRGPVGYSPEGYLDYAVGGDGTVHVSGWAFDRDNPSASLSIHVYVGGPAGVGVGNPNIVANLARVDVNKAYGITGKHGFDATFKTSKRGVVLVYAYGINVGGGSNAQLTDVKEVTITDPAGVASQVAPGSYAIRSKLNAAMGLDVHYASKSENASIALHEWNGGANQRYDVSAVSGLGYSIIAQNSSKALEVYGASDAKGKAITQHTQNKSAAQQWFFEKNSDGTWSIRNKATGLYLDVSGSKASNGMDIVQDAKSGGASQRFYLLPVDASRWSISVMRPTYSGKTLKPAVTVRAGGVTLKEGVDYSVSYHGGTTNGTVTIAAKNGFNGSVSKSYQASAIPNPLQVSVKTPSVKASAVKRAAQTIAAAKAFGVSGAQGKVAYKKKSGNKKIAVASNGKVTVKKGLKKGAYKVKVAVTAAGNGSYKAGTKTVTLTVRVR